MATRKANRKPSKSKDEGQQLVEIDRPVFESAHGGIYERKKLAGKKRETVTIDELHQMAQAIADDRSLESELVRVSLHAAAAIRPHAEKSSGDTEVPGRRHYSYDLGEGKRIYSLPEQPTDELATAQRIMCDVDAVRLAVRRGTDRGALEVAYELGRMAERLVVLPHEPDASIGKVRRLSGRQANFARSTKCESHKKWVRQEYAAYLKADPTAREQAIKWISKAFPDKFPGDAITVGTIKKYVKRRIAK